MKKVFIKTYGCQMNERDSEQVAAQLLARGYTLAAYEAEADVILLNTCSVRDAAEQKALSKMGFLAKRLKRDRPATAGKPEVALGFLGCMAQRRGAELLDRVPDVDLIIGTQKFHRVADYLDELTGGDACATNLNGAPRAIKIVDIAEEEGSESAIRDHLITHHQSPIVKPTAFISIMQGCDMHCTFCIVPTTRGAERSRSIEEIVTEVRELVAQGIKEVALLGQIVTSYGRKNIPRRNGKKPFVQLLEALDEIEGLERVRFTSPHPRGFTDDLTSCYGRLRTLCEAVHLPVQSGSNRILKAMGRPYTLDLYLRIVEKLRTRVPDIALTTDIIVGFPSETDEDFAATRQLIEQVQFDHAFIFKFSPRSGTPAAVMPNQVPQEIKEVRNHELLQLLNHISARKHAARVGQTLEVLVEGPSERNPQLLFGRDRRDYAVIFDGSPRHVGQLIPVHITHANPTTLYGEPVLVGLDEVSSENELATFAHSHAILS